MIEVLKQALDALNYLQGIVDTERGPKAAEALRQAIDQAEKQEPVAWMNDSTPAGIFARHKKGAENFGCTIPLYTHQQPKREWVGLTDDELEKVFPAIATYHEANKTLYRSIARTIEAKLKQKNGYAEEKNT